MVVAGYYLSERLKHALLDVIEVELNQIGVFEPSLDGASIAWIGADIRSLSFNVKKGKQRYSVLLEGVSFRTSIDALQKRQFDQLRIQQAVVTLERLPQRQLSDDVSSVKAPKSWAALPIPSDVFLLLPVSTVEISKYSVVHKSDRWRIQSDSGVNLNQNELTSHLSIFHPSLPDLKARITLNAANQATVYLEPIIQKSDPSLPALVVNIKSSITGRYQQLNTELSTDSQVSHIKALLALRPFSDAIANVEHWKLFNGVLESIRGSVSVSGDFEMPFEMLHRVLERPPTITIDKVLEEVKGQASLQFSLRHPDDELIVKGSAKWRGGGEDLVIKLDKLSAGSAFVQQQLDMLSRNGSSFGDGNIREGELQVSANVMLDLNKMLNSDDVVSALRGHGQILFSDVSAEGKEVVLSNLDGVVNLKVDPEGVAFSSDEISLGSLLYGVELSSLKATFEGKVGWENNDYHIDVKSMTGDLLGGTLSALPFSVAGPTANTEFEIHLNALKLSEVLALQANEELTGEGLLSGFLQGVVQDSVFEIKEGHLGSGQVGSKVSAGRIRYERSAAAEAVAKSDPSQQVAFVLEAMEDFHYSSLETDVTLTAPDNLHLIVALKGANPSFEQGRAIHLNLNLEENINPLIQALGINNELNSSILKQYHNK